MEVIFTVQGIPLGSVRIVGKGEKEKRRKGDYAAMPYKKLYNIVEKMVSHVLFTYKGLSCGIDPLSKEKIEVWCGDEYIIANSISEVFSVKIFDGKSLKSICTEIKDIEY